MRVSSYSKPNLVLVPVLFVCPRMPVPQWPYCPLPLLTLHQSGSLPTAGQFLSPMLSVSMTAMHLCGLLRVEGVEWVQTGAESLHSPPQCVLLSEKWSNWQVAGRGVWEEDERETCPVGPASLFSVLLMGAESGDCPCLGSEDSAPEPRLTGLTVSLWNQMLMSSAVIYGLVRFQPRRL